MCGAGELDAALPAVAAEILAALEAPTIYARAFAPLILAELLSRDARQPTLAPELLKTLRSAWAHWYLSETDLRSHDPQHGWLHALAHGADAALCFALRCILPLPATTTAPRLTPTPGQPRPAARSSRPRRGRGGRLSCLQCCGWRFRPPRSDPGAAPSPFTHPVRASCKLPGI